MVPSMLLQPLVENAIRHGIEGRMSGGTILVSASCVENQIQIRIADDGIGLPRNWQLENSSGVGVRVTRERLEALYPELDEQRFSIRPRQSGGTEVVIQIPFHGSVGKA
jgi:LytS/YehU family sensor histidine kinase